MYIKKLTNTTVELIFNKPKHGIQFASSPLVILLSAEDFSTVIDWKTAGEYAGAIAPELTFDSEDRNPGDEGYVPTYTNGTPAVWTLLGNQVCMLEDGSVELRDPSGTLMDTLTGTVVS